MNVILSLINGHGSGPVAVRITLYYIIIGALWIAFSDRLLITIFQPETVSAYAHLQTFKGWFFIVMTAALLYGLISSNIRRLRHEERERRRFEEIYRTIFETTGSATIIVEEDTTISMVNREFENLSGYSKKDIEGRKSWTEFVEAEDRERLLEYHAKRQSDPASVPSRYEFKFVSRHGAIRNIFIAIAVIPDTKQSIAALLDVTEKKELEMKYLRAQRLDSIGTLGGGIAHDLNNILAPILLSTHSLMRSAEDPVNRRLLSIIETSTKRGAELTKQILTFARGFQGEFMDVKPRYLLKEIESIIRATFPRMIDIDINIADNLREIKGEPIQIHQALLNVCINARDAMPDGGTLTISADNAVVDERNRAAYPDAAPGTYIQLSITDTGHGIPVDVREKLFMPFFTTKTDGKGTGLGLPTVEYILNRHGGFLSIDTEVGRGTTFHLFFPASADERERPEGEDPDRPVYMGNNDLLLLVDDDAAVTEITAEVLKSHGYRVVSAINGADGVAKYLRYKDEIALVLTDNNMPIMDGTEMVRRLIDIDPDVRILMTSGMDEETAAFDAGHPNIVGFIQKPYTTRVLLEKLYTALQVADGASD
jgi:PAS domain S-box-containing protein